MQFFVFRPLRNQETSKNKFHPLEFNEAPAYRLAILTLKPALMKVSRLFYCCLLFAAALESNAQRQAFKVMAWNILHGGNDVKNGVHQVISIIKEINPDIVLMVETYGSGKMIADSLGYNFHLIAPEGTPPDDKRINLSVFSKFPFGEKINTPYPFYLGGIEIRIRKRKIRCFTNWFHYEPWSDAPEKLGKSTAELLVWEKSGRKHEMIQNVLPYLSTYVREADSVAMILGGDFNTPSHLDWGQDTKKLHHGLAVPWYATKVL